MNERDKILSRIRKLLALGAAGSGATEGERDNALRMAHATLAKYNLTLSDADSLGQPQNAEPRVNAGDAAVSHPWMRTVAFAVAKLYFCEYYYAFNKATNITTHHFIGRESNTETAKHMMRYLWASINKESRPYAKTSGGQRNFAKGAAAKIYARCTEMVNAKETAQPTGETGTAMVLASLYASEQAANKALIARSVGPLVSKKSTQRTTNLEAYAAGSAYGGRVGLNTQIRG